MAVTEERRTRSRRSAVATWATVAAVPAAWVLGIFLVFASGEAGARHAGSTAVGLLGVAVFAAVPAAAVALAVRLWRTGHPSGQVATVVAASLLTLTLVATTLVGPLALIAVVIVMTPLGIYLWRSRSDSPPRPDDEH